MNVADIRTFPRVVSFIDENGHLHYDVEFTFCEIDGIGSIYDMDYFPSNERWYETKLYFSSYRDAEKVMKHWLKWIDGAEAR